MDLIIKNGKIIDGSGNPWFNRDLGISGGRIKNIGNLSTEESTSFIDAKGLVVAPGFIDMHSHSDFSLLVNPRAESKVRQGVTTDVIGNCGISGAPLDDFCKDEIVKTTPILKEAGLKLNWSTMKE